MPRLPLLVLVAALAGAGVLTVTVLIGLLFWPPMARIIRSRTLSLRGRGFVESARGFGAVASNAVLLEASLAFLGLADPTAVSWGLDINCALAEPGLYSPRRGCGGCCRPGSRSRRPSWASPCSASVWSPC